MRHQRWRRENYFLEATPKRLSGAKGQEDAFKNALLRVIPNSLKITASNLYDTMAQFMKPTVSQASEPVHDSVEDFEEDSFEGVPDDFCA